MSLASSLESLRKIDVNDLDLNNIGSWPAAVKVIVCVLLTAAVLALGYNFHLRDLQTQLEQQAAQEESLKQQFATKAFQAANLEAYCGGVVLLARGSGWRRMAGSQTWRGFRGV